jgi:hypothetical protein
MEMLHDSGDWMWRKIKYLRCCCDRCLMVIRGKDKKITDRTRQKTIIQLSVELQGDYTAHDGLIPAGSAMLQPANTQTERIDRQC